MTLNETNKQFFMKLKEEGDKEASIVIHMEYKGCVLRSTISPDQWIYNNSDLEIETDEFSLIISLNDAHIGYNAEEDEYIAKVGDISFYFVFLSNDKRG